MQKNKGMIDSKGTQFRKDYEKGRFWFVSKTIKWLTPDAV